MDSVNGGASADDFYSCDRYRDNCGSQSLDQGDVTNETVARHGVHAIERVCVLISLVLFLIYLKQLNIISYFC